ncbi:unnamed protein product [Caenorhabditis brenneri]
MQTLLIVSLVASVSSFDFVVESFKNYVNRNVPPCDNFFRHACKLGSPENVMPSVFTEFVQNALKAKPRSWDNFQILEDIRRWKTENKTDVVEKIAQLYFDSCEAGNTQVFVEELTPILEQPANGCDGHSCYVYLSKDPDCYRGELHVEELLKQFVSSSKKTFELDLDKFYGNIAELITLIHDINVHLDEDVREGIDLSKQFLKDMKVLAEEWILDTPWVNNNNVTNSTTTVLSAIKIEDNYGKLMRDAIDTLTTLEMIHRDCKENYHRSPETDLFCLVYTMSIKPVSETMNWFSSVEAFNDHPRIGLGYAFYYVAKYSEDMSGKLGFTGFTVGHELSHSLIKSTPADFLTYFSEEARKCVQDQFNSTCAMFKENSCVTVPEQFDDNGADIMGIRLAYKQLENYYETKLKEVYEPLGVTHQQLFFYSLVFSFCEGDWGRETGEEGDGQHSSTYIRLNAMLSQTPGFADAFQCSEDSRMMRSRVEECIVYGEGAPEMKKH